MIYKVTNVDKYIQHWKQSKHSTFISAVHYLRFKRLASVYQIGLPYFPAWGIKCWLKFEWNECHVFYGVIRKVKCVGTAAEALAWLGLFVACLCSVNRSLSVRLVSPMYCFLHRLHSIIHISFVDLHVICCLISRTSPVLLMYSGTENQLWSVNYSAT